MITFRFSTASFILIALALLSGVPGLLSLAGSGQVMHPLLTDQIAGAALLVIATSCLGAALFPTLAVSLTQRENAANLLLPAERTPLRRPP